MRITNQTMVTRSLDRLQTRLQAYERGQSQLATGKRILRPSDDPGGSRRAMSLRASLEARQQELRNADDARGWLDNADTQLQSGLSRLQRVRELTVAAANSQGAWSRDAIAAEIRQIGEELLGIANARHLGRPLFGGFAAGDAVTGAPGTFAFTPAGGETEAVTRRVSDSEKVTVNVTAAQWLGVGGADGDLLTLLGDLADEIQAGDAAVVGGRLAALDRALATISDNLATIGAATNRVDAARERALDNSLTIRTELSNVEDVDVAQGMMELQIQEIGYQATLQALAQALPPSLVSFLR
jgi:flagellar hook-associated protein 3 FlgL